MIYLIVLFLSLSISESNAHWLCRENSSTRVGQTITACGVGTAKDLDSARLKSRENAIEEFKRICSLSAECHDFDYVIKPKRTDCENKNQTYTCYRALDFEITDIKRRSVVIDLRDLESELAAKNKEIFNIQLQIEKINQVKQAKTAKELKINELANLGMSLEAKEAETLKLEDLTSKATMESGGYQYTHQAYRNSIKVGFNYWASRLISDSENDILWMFAYEHRPFDWIGLQVHGGFGRGYLSNQKHKEEDVPTQGPPNTSAAFNGDMAYTDIGLAVLVYSGWLGVYLKADYGLINGRSESYSINYNGSGAGSANGTDSKFSDTYAGLSIGFDSRDSQKGWGVYFEVGARKTFKADKIGLNGGLGINYGF